MQMNNTNFLLQEKSAEKYNSYVRNMTIMDDALFEEYIKDPDACEELIQTILDNNDIRIRPETLSPQKSIHIVGKRSIRVDAYVEGSEDELYNIEIQRADNCNHIKRVRYNASMLTVNASVPGISFEDVKNVIIIYISEFDIFHLGLAVYHVQNMISETGVKINDGASFIYINTAIKDNSKASKLVQHFTEPIFNDSDFPKSSARIKMIKNDSQEASALGTVTQELMIMTLIEDWLEDNKSEGEMIHRLCKKFGFTEEEARDALTKFIPQLV